MSPTESMHSAGARADQERAALKRLLQDGGTGFKLAPLSFAEERMWFISRLRPADPVYHITSVLRLRGPLRPPQLEAAFSEVVRRHEILRTIFPTLTGGPMQLVRPPGAVRIAAIDLSDLDDAARDTRIRAIAEAQARDPFDLARGPLFRVQLARVQPTEHVLAFTAHHIIMDGWSAALLVDELREIYNAAVAGRPSSLPDLPLQYREVATWEREQAAGDLFDRQVAYWTNQLAGSPPLLALPVDHPRPAVQGSSGEAVPIDIPVDLAASLRRCCEEEHLTLFMFLVAAFALVLSRYSQQDTVVIGSPVAHRSRPEFEGLIGMFANTLALRIDLAGTPTPRELLRRVRETCIGAYEHQDLPFERLVEILQPPRALGHTPLFQVMCVVQTSASVPASRDTDAVEIQALPFECGIVPFDLVLSLTDRAPMPSGKLAYRTELFERATIDRLVRHWIRQMRTMVDAPDRPVSALTMMDEGESERMLAVCRGEVRERAWAGGIHEWFERRAAAAPARPAVLAAGTAAATFGEVNRRANWLAHHLLARGCRAEDRVAVCLPRGLDAIVASFAVLKAGGVFVPVDLHQPEARLARILSSCAPAFLIATRHTPPPDTVGAPCIWLDDDAIAIEGCSDANPDRRPLADQLAYIIHTSGSTGDPKGVMVSHGSLANYLGWAIETYRLDEGRGAPLHAHLAFDMMVTTLWGCLAAGTPLILIAEGQEVASLPGVVSDARNLTLLKLTPSHAFLLSRALSPSEVPHRVRTMVLGGEALQAETLALWRTYAPQTRIVNEYGPTEATVGCCVHEMDPGAAYAGSVPIGRPIANTCAYVLDASLRPVAPGVTGELSVGGAGLARGYFREPALTAERFLPDPVSGVPGARLYRTGDLARLVNGSHLEYLGRRDSQVKVHGFRVELGEIESVLGQHPRVRHAAVTLSRALPGHEEMAAHVVADAGVTAHELRGWLQARLPSYMIPATITMNDALPLGTHGKVNRQSLSGVAGPPLSSSSSSAEHRRLTTILTSIWADLLKIDDVGLHDNFFDLGGHSMLMVRVQSRLEAALGRSVPITTLFSYATIDALARHLVDQEPSV